MQNYEIVDYADYVAKQGDTFDAIALELYNDEFMSIIVAKANPEHIGVLIFEGGEKLRLPLIDETETAETLPPWRR